MVEIGTSPVPRTDRESVLVENTRILLTPVFVVDVGGSGTTSEMIDVQNLLEDENPIFDGEQIAKMRNAINNLLLDAPQLELREREIQGIHRALDNLRLLTDPHTYQLSLL